MKNERIITTKTGVGHVAEEYSIKCDLGYCITKVICENGQFYFPSCVKKIMDITDKSLDLSKEDILYRDEEGDIYLIGQTARNMEENNGINKTKMEMLYLIVCKAAIGVVLLSRSDTDKRPIILEIGLASYKDNPEDVRDILSQEMHFSLKIGDKPWENINTVISKDNIHIKSQPNDMLEHSIIFD